MFKFFNKNSCSLLSLAFFVLGLVPLSSQRIEAFLSIIFVVLLFAYSYKIRNKERLVYNKSFVINSFLFIVLLLTLIDGIDLKTFKKLEQMFSLLIFPIVFYLISKENIKLLKHAFNVWKKTFFLSTVLLSFVCFIIFFNYSNPKYPSLDLNFFRNAIQDATFFSRHPIYISIFLNIATFIALEALFKSKTIILKTLFSLAILVFNVLLFLLSTKMAIISFFLSLIVYIFFKLNRKVFFISISTILCLMLFLMIFSPKQINGFSKLFEKKILTKNERYNSIYIHKETILCSIKIINENFFLGKGAENSDYFVNKCLRENYKYNPDKVYNSHNQYLSFALHSGVLGFLLIIIVLINALKNSIKKNKLLFVFMLYFALIFLTENILERQTGIILFAFILNLITLLQHDKNYIVKD